MEEGSEAPPQVVGVEEVCAKGGHKLDDCIDPRFILACELTDIAAKAEGVDADAKVLHAIYRALGGDRPPAALPCGQARLMRPLLGCTASANDFPAQPVLRWFDGDPWGDPGLPLNCGDKAPASVGFPEADPS